VADGRKRDTAYIDSIAQGRVWTGERAVGIGLVDRIGGIEEAIRSAATLAKIKEYNIREYPEPKSPLDILFGSFSSMNKSRIMEDELGRENYDLYLRMKRLKENMGIIQARVPFEWKWN
jgi:protease-4